MRAPFLVAWAAVTALLAGCGASSGGSHDGGPGPNQGGTGGVGGMVNSDLPSSLEFETVGTLPAHEPAVLNLRAKPPRAYRVRFSLPTSEGMPLDAVLDRTEATTDSQGLASVVLTTPSRSTEFSVRATVETVTTSLPITVQDTGLATVQVAPQYGGFRTITTWRASAYPDKTCSELHGIPPEDGPLLSPPAAAVSSPAFEVPAMRTLAITLRSGHFVGGCATVEPLAAAPATSPYVVKVTVLERPIDLRNSALSVSLSYDGADGAYAKLVGDKGMLWQQALRGTSDNDVDALLDAMRESSGAGKQAFETSRKAENWDGLVATAWGASSSTKITDLTATWLAAGKQKLNSSATPLFMGNLKPVAQADAADGAPTASLSLTTVAGLDATLAGFVPRSEVSWSASADDTLSLGTSLYFVQSQLCGALAESAALAAVDGSTSAPDALSRTLDCAGLATKITAAGSDESESYPGCDAACIGQACLQATQAVWQRGKDATGVAPATLSIAATGKALVGDTAQVVGLAGTWIGQSTLGAATGPLTAVEPTK